MNLLSINCNSIISLKIGKIDKVQTQLSFLSCLSLTLSIFSPFYLDIFVL